MKKPLETVQPDAIVARLNELDVEKVQKMKAPSSTTLTDEEIAQITKGVFIEGTFLGDKNPVLFPANYFSDRYYQGVYIGGTNNTNTIGCYLIDMNDKSISITPYRYNKLNSVLQINGKEWPSYPANDVTKYFKGVNGTLAWGDVNMEDIVDAQGNKRFIEGDGLNNPPTGVTYTYSKFSLSGSHLMIVLAGIIANGTELAVGDINVSFEVPEWVFDKLLTIISSYVGLKSVVSWNEDWSTQSISIGIRKLTSPSKLINLINTASFTATKDRVFRFEFDFIIDTEYNS